MKTMVLGTLLISIFLAEQAQASLTLKCEGWLQRDSAQLQRTPMIVTEQTNLNWKQTVTVEEYNFKVNWDVSLDAIYSEIYQGDQRILFTTARVPTFPHNDSFTDLKIPGGPRLAISCDFAQ